MREATEYVRIYEDLHKELLKAQADENSKPDTDPSCPPKVITVRTPKGDTFTVKIDKQIATGSSSRLLRTNPVNGKSYIIKTVTPLKRGKKLSMATKLALLQDQAFMTAFNQISDFAPKIFPIVRSANPDMDAYCYARTIVSEDVGSTELRDLPRAVINNTPAMYSLARKAVLTLKTLHESGLIHGDIHRRNWLVSDVERPGETLRLIDFGRVMPYLNLGTGTHIEDNTIPWEVKFTGWNELLLSPWEILGGKKSRRDDFFRTAEMFLYMIAGPVDVWFRSEYKKLGQEYKEDKITEKQLLEKIADLKFKRVDQLKRSRVPKFFVRFYEYSLRLEFDERPNYDKWIKIFGIGASE